MNDFKENVKKRPGPKLTNRRNYAYSTCCDYHSAFNISWNINTNANRR